MIDILAAIESVVEAAVTLHERAVLSPDTRHAGLTATALTLAVPACRQPSTAAALLDQLRADPPAAARAAGATLGAMLVWRAVDRAEGAGAAYLDAAEAGVRSGLAYIDLVAVHQFVESGLDDVDRRAALAILELQARLALSGSVPHPAPADRCPRPRKNTA